MKKTATLIVYTFSVFITVTAYEVYTEFISGYNFGLALALFEFFSLITITTLYPFLERYITGKLKIREEVAPMSMKKALTLQPLAIIYLSMSNAFKFILMLPFLTSLDNSLLFVIFLLLSNLVKVPFAVKIFQDRLKDKKIYFLGMITVFLGGLAYAINPFHLEANILNTSAYVIVAVLFKSVLEVIDSLVMRYITTAKSSGPKTVTVQRVEEIKTYFTVGIGLLIGTYLLNKGNQAFLPNMSQLGGILWIGVVVSLSGTLAIRLLTEITHTISQPIQGLRPLIAFLIFAFFSNEVDGRDLIYKGLCMLPILLGVFLCLKNGHYTNQPLTTKL